MKRVIVFMLFALMIILSAATCKKSDNKKIDESVFNKVENARVPAEWEPHAATWMQWPAAHDASMQQAFSDIIKVVKEYEPMHLIATSEIAKVNAIRYLTSKGITQDNITWHIFTTDNSWLRDNGPIYVASGDKMLLQNWRFDGWGSSFGGDVDYNNDNEIPIHIGGYLGIEVEDRLGYILEKGNVEVNGKGVLLINWDCQKQRNPKFTKEQHETVLKNALGVTKIIWSYGHHADDGTYGHIDGIARFINENTVVIPDYGTTVETSIAETCRNEGFTVHIYPGDPNWLVGNGFVVGMGSNDNNDELKALLKQYFPTRDIYMIDAQEIAKNGGGVHCVTNDQPLLN
ncbi:MAG: agmatine deiminase family protein [Bacteroidales bacterium]|jgi:agmatine deiminase|nr:agmatine deiminase family protein [Bacteroidales bacterium]